MKTIFSTADVRPRDRFDSWHAAARKYIIDHDSRPACRLTFAAKLCCAALDEMTLVSFECSPMIAAHTSRHVSQTTPDELFVCRELTGSMLIEQSSREVALKAGDVTLVDPRLPYSARFSSDSSLLVLKVPRQRLEARVGRTGHMVARVMSPAHEENGFVSDFLALLPAHVERLGLTASTVADQALDLLAVALAKMGGVSGPRVSSARFVVLTRLRSAIEKQLTNPALDPAAAAAAAGVSVRYANAVLADENTSVARLIQTRRLERCRQALCDFTQAHRSISEIAYCWGFSDMTHFGRRFRAAYGLLPSEYRKVHGPGSMRTSILPAPLR
ncbi:MAG TPA: helix-turn-helix domain-containing protein [Steroidobacteraceae bacterium]|jgi:AraC family transcriptional activator of tynA and feaB|nr:helix-turn-helix domain-containing protein [Steroidobacteraceae bacterium]